MSRFKVGDVIGIVVGCELTMLHGWYHTMILKIIEVRDDSYFYEHLTDAAPSWKAGTKAVWIHSIIDNNFSLNKAGTILYGKF